MEVKAIGPGIRLDVAVRKETRRTNARFLAYANYWVERLVPRMGKPGERTGLNTLLLRCLSYTNVLLNLILI